MKNLTIPLWVYIYTTFFSIFVIGGCSARHEPAPVSTLSTRLASTSNLTEILGDTYTVKPGDTLFSIAFYSGNSYRDLALWNDIQAPFRIYPKQTLKLRNLNRRSTTANKTKSHPAKPSSTPKIVTADKPKQVIVDDQSTQAYRGEQSKHRKIQISRSKASTKSYKERQWIWPAKGINKVATVGIDGNNRGIDILGVAGTDILAAANGKVVYAGNALKGYGNLIIVKHDENYLSAYAHNERILVTEQSYVTQGQKIATMGNSGASETMLHFEIRKKGRSIDPLEYLP
ncbi:peptidoglycan DD-metalloendopeptidase family protein [Agaribacter marinus]|uniref:peptidoglycan DD-metalloendopeptidase family protein n=1 Tax=Agaribacter marinus TaxID=1431249 RepID=UPI0024E136D6|nr:peptidoglycan DD-metalloendopeptidase family protein [Agaribacter marinus]